MTAKQRNFIGFLFFSLSVLPCRVEAQQFAPPIMGWSSWNTFHVNISDSLIRTQADAMVRLGLKDVGYTHINIDDGFFGWRDASGEMHPHPQRFPNGLKVVADYIHSKGLMRVQTRAVLSMMPTTMASVPAFMGTKSRMPDCISAIGALISSR